MRIRPSEKPDVTKAVVVAQNKEIEEAQKIISELTRKLKQAESFAREMQEQAKKAGDRIDEIEAECERRVMAAEKRAAVLISAIEEHRRNVWGIGGYVTHSEDEKLYAVLGEEK